MVTKWSKLLALVVWYHLKIDKLFSKQNSRWALRQQSSRNRIIINHKAALCLFMIKESTKRSHQINRQTRYFKNMQVYLGTCTVAIPN